MNRRRALWLTGIATLVLFGVEAAFDLRMQDAGGHGIVDFELAGSLDHSRRMLEFWGHDGHVAARWSLWFDYGYLIAYGAFVALAVAGLRDTARRRGWGRFARVAAVLVAFPIAAAAFDAVEDVGLLLALGRHGGAVAPRLATVCAIAKFVLIEIAIVFVIVALVRLALERWRAATAVALAAFALALAALVVNGMVVANRTAPADASAGAIVHVPGADLHVADQGPRGTSALVLLHGWGASIAHWEAAGRILARTHRVIRVDLLGFGASSKPASGYGMEHQARLVLDVVRRLGVTHAVVVGHSMGGIVAASAAEQGGALVRGVAVVDTPPIADAGTVSVSDYALFSPVVGPDGWDLAPDSLVRNGLKVGFARGFDVPERFVSDLRRATYTSFTRSAIDSDDFRRARRLDRRVAATGKPLLVVYGRDDRLVDPHADAAWRVPGARVVGIADAGHSPQVERPRLVAGLIERFAGPLLRP
jgi:pimeloyl-ACP methyl ester carboxylesterase